MKTKEIKPIASLTVCKLAEMTPEGRKRVASWLRKQARYLEKHGDEFGGQCTMRLKANGNGKTGE